MLLMGRRGLSSLRAVALVAGLVFVVYCYYVYDDLQTELRKRDSREERVKRQLDTVSSELETLYEQKVNLEKAVRDEKEEAKKFKDAHARQTQLLEASCTKEKEALTNRITAITEENKRLEGRLDDLERAMSKLQEEDEQLKEDKEKIAEQYKEEYMKLKNDRDATISQLRVRVTELEQQNAATENELRLRLSDIGSLQSSLKTSQHEYSQLQELHRRDKELCAQAVKDAEARNAGNLAGQPRQPQQHEVPANDAKLDIIPPHHRDDGQQADDRPLPPGGHGNNNIQQPELPVDPANQQLPPGGHGNDHNIEQAELQFAAANQHIPVDVLHGDDE